MGSNRSGRSGVDVDKSWERLESRQFLSVASTFDMSAFFAAHSGSGHDGPEMHAQVRDSVDAMHIDSGFAAFATDHRSFGDHADNTTSNDSTSTSTTTDPTNDSRASTTPDASKGTGDWVMSGKTIGASDTTVVPPADSSLIKTVSLSDLHRDWSADRTPASDPTDNTPTSTSTSTDPVTASTSSDSTSDTTTTDCTTTGSDSTASNPTSTSSSTSTESTQTSTSVVVATPPPVSVQVQTPATVAVTPVQVDLGQLFKPVVIPTAPSTPTVEVIWHPIVEIVTPSVTPTPAVVVEMRDGGFGRDSERPTIPTPVPAITSGDFQTPTPIAIQTPDITPARRVGGEDDPGVAPSEPAWHPAVTPVPVDTSDAGSHESNTPSGSTVTVNRGSDDYRQAIGFGQYVEQPQVRQPVPPPVASETPSTASAPTTTASNSGPVAPPPIIQASRGPAQAETPSPRTVQGAAGQADTSQSPVVASTSNVQQTQTIAVAQRGTAGLLNGQSNAVSQSAVGSANIAGSQVTSFNSGIVATSQQDASASLATWRDRSNTESSTDTGNSSNSHRTYRLNHVSTMQVAGPTGLPEAQNDWLSRAAGFLAQALGAGDVADAAHDGEAGWMRLMRSPKAGITGLFAVTGIWYATTRKFKQSEEAEKKKAKRSPFQDLVPIEE
jgi:hypothetical protein